MNHVSLLPYLRVKKREQLEAMGVEFMEDIPADFPLTNCQENARQCARKRTPLFNRSGIQPALKNLKCPLAFMDFETTYPAIPRCRGMSPFDHIPFQWSLHIQYKTGAKPEHYAFLAQGKGDEREAFITSLLKAIEKAQNSSIVVYHCAFEKSRLQDLAEWFPRYATKIKQLCTRLFDLLPVVRQNAYHRDFRGSFSLKSVLPALVPGMEYDSLAIGAGDEAMSAFEQIVRCRLSAAQERKIRQALLAYGKQDTLALVRLLDRLRTA